MNSLFILERKKRKVIELHEAAIANFDLLVFAYSATNYAFLARGRKKGLQ